VSALANGASVLVGVVLPHLGRGFGA
jgi:hypothetical protein